MNKQTETIKIRWGNHISEWYTPRKNKVKLSLISMFIIACLITPFTNWLMIPMFKLMGRFPLWLYR